MGACFPLKPLLCVCLPAFLLRLFAHLLLLLLLCSHPNPLKKTLQVLQQLEQAKHVPDFNNYLSFIFSKGDNLPLEVRVTSGEPAMVCVTRSLQHSTARHSTPLSSAGWQHTAAYNAQRGTARHSTLRATAQWAIRACSSSQLVVAASSRTTQWLISGCLHTQHTPQHSGT